VFVGVIFFRSNLCYMGPWSSSLALCHTPNFDHFKVFIRILNAEKFRRLRRNFYREVF